jgi:hypothetical protein
MRVYFPPLILRCYTCGWSGSDVIGSEWSEAVWLWTGESSCCYWHDHVLDQLLVKLILTQFSMLRKASSTVNCQRSCLLPTNTDKYETGFVSWNSDQTVNWTTNESGFLFRRGQESLISSTAPKSALGSSSIPKVPAALSLELKGPPLVPRLKMHGAISPLSHGAILY